MKSSTIADAQRPKIIFAAKEDGHFSGILSCGNMIYLLRNLLAFPTVVVVVIVKLINKIAYVYHGR